MSDESREEELRRLLHEAHRQLLERDELIRSLTRSLGRRRGHRFTPYRRVVERLRSRG